jgi:calcium/calmodulin-dependent protein kinase I
MNTTNNFVGDLMIQNMIVDQPTATLYEAKDRKNGEVYAIKLPKRNDPQIDRELSILKKISHPYIVPVREFETANGSGLVMPFAFGGDLFSWIELNPLDEDTVRVIIFNLLHALAYLHSKQIWHRDIKPENMLVMEHSLSPECIVLADFGFAREFEEGICYDEFCGSLQYAAPELLRGDPYTEKIDIWSLGITMYACLTSAFPFGSDPDDIRREILAGLPRLFEGDRLDVSQECRSLLDWMLSPDPWDRPSAEQALDHEWFETLWFMKDESSNVESAHENSVEQVQ